MFINLSKFSVPNEMKMALLISLMCCYSIVLLLDFRISSLGEMAKKGIYIKSGVWN